MADSDCSKTLYCFFIKTIAGKVWFSSISRKFATEKEFIFNGKDAVCITQLPQQLDVRLYSSRLRAGRNENIRIFAISINKQESELDLSYSQESESEVQTTDSPALVIDYSTLA